MYLFFFAILFVIFQYMNEKAIFENQEQQIESMSEKLTRAQDSLKVLNERTAYLNYFSLQGNENAMTYLENLGFEAQDIEDRVAGYIRDQNLQEGNHPMVPYEGMIGPMKINKIKFLNHRWILTDFTDGKYWGEMLLEYYFNENNELEIVTLGSLLYPNT
ncbi:hypothetical protein ALE3EI_2083 [Constantimarinum furrinae]|uniref:Hydrolase n=2 Tax=Constantimarinum furrinae TaxID=2562285 RepID=A0A7G8PWB4_9FLAO|nr:hypothetical protein ALE3EI_2083 [Constantimarinum furrinae]